ncbi:glycerophosphodiester phosphodiesterase GDPD4 isoform X2 [Magnolia sinica]|uniref:glycerophosphodiester phosphodiesterase GDPD4 isoform X2 n=1 Tax=Magnolia sinica TaxID=86752 RepID=UPI00265AEDCA|nr:glycerophosphodiester phosphodiesterase GDPD4 isoform X2 [Magnolia sinica]
MLACAITRALFISYKEWELSLSENWRGKRKGMAIPKQRKKQPQRSLHSRLWKRFLRFSSKRFLRLLLIIGFIAFIPPIFFHFRLRRFHQMQLQKCGWLDDPPLVCAHGGDSSKSVPNTMDAYRAALLSQVDCIEVDVSRSLDGVLFALHDRDLQRMSGNSTAKVGYFNMNELISKSVRQVILDAKVGPPSYEKGLAADILSVVKETKCTNCLIWAKSDILGRDVIRLSQNVTVGYIVMRDPSTGARTNLLRMKRAGVIGVYYPLIDEKLVRISHGRGKKVYAWTVDDEDSMKKMLAERVDGIVTNQPSLLQRLMQTIKTECLEAGFSLP